MVVGSLLALSSCNQGSRVSDDVKDHLKGKAEKHLRDSEQWGKVEMRELDKDFADELESLKGVDVEVWWMCISSRPTRRTSWW